MGVIQDLLTGVGAEGVFEVSRVIHGYTQQDQLGRLLLLIDKEFGDESELDRSAFLQWRTHDDLEQGLKALLGGDFSRSDEELAGLIEPRLAYTPDQGKRDLARRIAAFARRAAPLAVKEVPQATAFLNARIEQEVSGSEARITGLMRDLSAGRDGGDHLGEALMRGPLDHANARQLIEEAQAVAETAPLRAAETLLEACQRLDDAGLGVVAETYRERAAELLRLGGEGGRAVMLLAEIARARLDRSSGLANSTLQRLRELSAPKPQWLEDFLTAMDIWPLDPSGAGELLSSALSEDIPLDWRAHGAELLLLLGRTAELAAVTKGREAEDFTGPNYRIELCVAEAETDLGESEGEQRWQRLLEWVDQRAEPFERGLMWQRRGFALATEDRVDEAIAAYRTAMGAWSRLHHGDEQVAEAFYCIQAASLNAARDPVDYELWPLAAELRGDSELPVARGERLEHLGMKQRLTNNLRGAVFPYSRALFVHHRTGSLQGVLAVRERLGELMNVVGEPLAAIEHYIAAGKSKQARQLARACNLRALEQALDLRGPGWQRAASYAVIAEVGEELSSEFVDAALTQLFHDAEAEVPPWRGPNVRASARLAICATSLKVAEAQRGRVLDLMREELARSWPENMQAASRALALGTDAGLWDEDEALLEAFLQDPNMSGVQRGWLAERAGKQSVIAVRLRKEALDGNRAALETLAWAQRSGGGELITGDSALVDLCTTYVEAAHDLRGVRKIEHEDRPDETQVGIGGNLADLGLLGAYADKKARAALADRLRKVLCSGEEPETHRASALAALEYLSAGASGVEAESLLEEIRPLAEGRYPASPWDSNEDHPLSAIRVSFHRPGVLRATALEFIGQLVEAHRELGNRWQEEIVAKALSDSEILVIRGALSAARGLMARELLARIEPHFAHENAQVRSAALQAWAAIGTDLPPIAVALSEDPAPLVRMTLATVATSLPAQQAAHVLEELASDADLTIRIKAESQAAQRT